MSKPKIYGYCPAGCKWEVPHKIDVDESVAKLKNEKVALPMVIFDSEASSAAVSGTSSNSIKVSFETLIPYEEFVNYKIKGYYSFALNNGAKYRQYFETSYYYDTGMHHATAGVGVAIISGAFTSASNGGDMGSVLCGVTLTTTDCTFTINNDLNRGASVTAKPYFWDGSTITITSIEQEVGAGVTTDTIPDENRGNGDKEGVGDDPWGN